MNLERVAVVIGGGVAGLVAAVELSLRGFSVTVLESAERAGGKVRQIAVDGRPIDSGPTVLTMHWVFEELFARAGHDLASHVTLVPAQLLARHAWTDGSRLDLFADLDRSADAIGELAGSAEARGYREFATHTQRIHDAVRDTFLLGQRPSVWSMVMDPGVRSLSPLEVDAHRSMARSLGSFFRDPRLVQLFGRYATYVGSSPYEAPGTLSLIAHVERCGVHYVEGGMIRLADALVALAEACGVTVRTGCDVRSIDVASGRARGVRVRVEGEELSLPAGVVVCAADVAALASGAFGEAARRSVDYDFSPPKRSLSALTRSAVARVRDFPMVRHNVFFAEDGKAEFDDLFRRRRLPRAPTAYVCAQDRTDTATDAADDERLFVIVNAPADADRHDVGREEREECELAMTQLFQRCGATIDWKESTWTTPTDFARRFPGTAGALYGRSSHGMLAALTRPAARTKVMGLYLAGGSVHPGAGVPMAALSGLAAARAIESDSAWTARSRRPVTGGSTSIA